MESGNKKQDRILHLLRVSVLKQFKDPRSITVPTTDTNKSHGNEAKPHADQVRELLAS